MIAHSINTETKNEPSEPNPKCIIYIYILQNVWVSIYIVQSNMMWVDACWIGLTGEAFESGSMKRNSTVLWQYTNGEIIQATE